MLVRIIKDWNYPNLYEQIPLPADNGIQFTYDDVYECDYVIVLNYLSKNIRVKCPSENIWLIIQEPYIPGIYDWVITQQAQYNKVFTHHYFSEHEKYQPSYPILPWHVGKTYSELVQEGIPNKKYLLSWITSNKTIFPGHKERMVFMEKIKNSHLNLHLFGRGINEIEAKWQGLSEYKYSLAIENSSSENYWTEKIADCFLSYTIPIYYGCTNIEDYFPGNSIIKIDINNPNEAIEIINNAIHSDFYENNFESLITARNLVLGKYNFFNRISNLIIEDKTDSVTPKKELTLKKYEESYVRRGRDKFDNLKGKLSKLKKRFY